MSCSHSRQLSHSRSIPHADRHESALPSLFNTEPTVVQTPSSSSSCAALPTPSPPAGQPARFEGAWIWAKTLNEMPVNTPESRNHARNLVVETYRFERPSLLDIESARYLDARRRLAADEQQRAGTGLRGLFARLRLRWKSPIAERQQILLDRKASRATRLIWRDIQRELSPAKADQAQRPIFSPIGNSGRFGR